MMNCSQKAVDSMQLTMVKKMKNRKVPFENFTKIGQVSDYIWGFIQLITWKPSIDIIWYWRDWWIVVIRLLYQFGAKKDFGIKESIGNIWIHPSSEALETWTIRIEVIRSIL